MSVESIMDGISGDGGEDDEPPKITRCRHAERTDIPRIARLIKCRTLESFGEGVTHPGIIYDKACLSLVQENELQQIVSAIFLCNYPNVPTILQSDWPTWMNKLYNVENSTVANTLFVHFLAWDDRYEPCFLGELLTATFYTAAFCTYVVHVQPPAIAPADSIRKEMTRVPPKNEANEVKAQVLYVGDQSIFIPQMKFRLVVEEDNDDVIQLLDAESPRLRELYGEFYISEMMRHPTDERRVIAAEKESSICALLCLNESVDLDLLSDEFELAAFAELRKIDEDCGCSDIFSFDEYGEEYGIDEDNDSSQLKQSENYADNEINNSKTMNSNVEDTGIETGNVNNPKSDENQYFENTQTREDTREEEEEDEEVTPVAREPDAFALELLGTRRPVDGLKCQGLLSAGFECFPGRDYCVMLVPTDRPHFPFLDNFVLVPPKADRDFPMSLYVVHRAALQGDLQAREARPTDRENVARLLCGVSDALSVLLDYDEAPSRSPENDCHRYVFTCDGIVVGLAIVCAEEEVELLRRCYRVEDLALRLENAADLECKDGRLLRLVLMPIFSSRLGFLLGEIMRLAGVRVLYHRAKLGVGGSEESRTVAPACFSVMQPVEPRIRNFPQFQRFYHKEDDALPVQELFSLFVMTPRLTMKTREIVNTKIVVVGASDCGLAFIDALALGYKYRDLQFTDITLISINGSAYEHSNNFSVKIMTPFRGRYYHAYRSLTPGRANYNVIKGTVVAIDRKRKSVQIENCGSLSYDYLVLTCGLFFQRPELANDSHREENDLNLETPSNCFFINDDVEAENCLKEIRRLTEDFNVKKSIVFYGCNIECYCALGAFLELGLEGSWITLIEPKLLAQDDIFYGDREIKDTLREILAAIGATVLSDRELLDWTIGPGGIVKSLLVDSTTDSVEIDCDALLSFRTKGPCPKTFLAIARAGLVFDGGLVIDAEFRTNDRRVFAAGTMTKYSGKLQKRPPDVHHNSLEVGEKLAEKFVSIIMAGIEDNESENPDSPLKMFDLKMPDYSFRMPNVISCLLPGGYRYLHVRKPDIRTPNKGIEINTEDFDIQNIIALYGKHEALLNNLKTRFLNSEIQDFYAYFREPWAAALFSDDFDDFLKKSKCFCSNSLFEKDDCKQGLIDYLKSSSALTNYEEISTEDRDGIASACREKSCYLQEMEDGLIEFLARHEDELPMYLTARKQRWIQREIEDTPLVRRDNGERRECICSCQSFA